MQTVLYIENFGEKCFVVVTEAAHANVFSFHNYKPNTLPWYSKTEILILAKSLTLKFSLSSNYFVFRGTRQGIIFRRRQKKSLPIFAIFAIFENCIELRKCTTLSVSANGGRVFHITGTEAAFLLHSYKPHSLPWYTKRWFYFYWKIYLGSFAFF